jgi:predicted amidohydrolase YtcJ
MTLDTDIAVETPADVLIVNARALTMDPSRPRASAVAIRANRILQVGDFDAKDFRGPATRVIDAKGKTVLPGFIDSHVHLFGGSGELTYPNLAEISGEAALRAVVERESRAKPQAKLLYAVCAGYHILGPDTPLDRHALDRISPDRPFAMMAADHHTVWANTAALELAGILHGGPTDPGAEIVMGTDAKATGVLLETSAFEPVVRHTDLGGRDFLGYITGDNPVPPATTAERERDKQALKQGLAHCAGFGITSLHNMDGNLYQMELLHELELEGALTCRVQVPCHLRNTHPLSKLEEAEEMRRRYTSDMLYSGRVKMFMDGVIDSYTALMVAPYPDRPDTFGDAVFTAEAFTKAAIRADAMGLQISVHCCGDGAVRRVLNGYEAAIAANGRRDSRHRIEHIETITDADIPRLEALGVIASMQPLHSPLCGLFDIMPPGVIFSDSQVRNAFAWQTLRNTGAQVIFSTDWPVAPLDPMLTIQGAVAFKTPDDRWIDQRQSLSDTLASYTCGGAFAEFAESSKGQLKAGMLADVAILSDDLHTVAPEALSQVRTTTTLCDGRIVYEATGN